MHSLDPDNSGQLGLSFGTIETGMDITKLEDLRGLEANQGTVDFSGRITNKSKGARGSFGATFGWKGCETHLFVVVVYR
jgi:hypothetical protein